MQTTRHADFPSSADKHGTTPMHQAAASGSTDAIQALFNEGRQSIDECDFHQKTPLHFAAENGQVPAIELLLQLGSNALDKDDSCGWKPLHFASYYGHTAAVAALIRLGSLALDAPIPSRFTPLHLAAKNGHAALVEQLVHLGSRAIDEPSDSGWTPMHSAARCLRGSVEVIQVLLNLGSQALNAENRKRQTPLHIAAKNGRDDAIHRLLKAGSNALNRADGEGMTPIHLAALRGHFSTIECLVDLGSSLAGACNKGKTSIYFAAEYGHTAILDTLYDLCKAALDQASVDGWTPMHAAANNGHAAAIEKLYKLGSRAIDVPDRQGCAPISLAAKQGHAAVIDKLIQLKSKASSKPDHLGDTPVHHAARGGHSAAIIALLAPFAAAVDSGSSPIDAPNAQNQRPLHLAASNGHIKAVETLVQLGSKAIDVPDATGCRPIHLAAQHGHSQTIALLVQLGSKAIDTPTDASDKSGSSGQVVVIGALVQFGARVIDTIANTVSGKTPMHLAAENGHAATIKMLVELGSKAISAPDEDGLAPIHLAALKGHVKAIEMIVQLNVECLDSLDNKGRTAMHMAAKSGQLEAIEILVRLGSRATNSPNKYGRVPMHIAAYYGHAKVIHKLIELGSGALDALDINRWTPLHVAARFNHVSVIEAILQCGSTSLDVMDLKGRRPIHLAAKMGNTSALSALIKLGSVAISAPNKVGWTPLHYAAYGGHLSAIEALVSLGSLATDPMDEKACRAIDTPDAKGKTPLYLAAKQGQNAAVHKLVELGSQAIDVPDRKLFRPMHVAAKKGHVEVIGTLAALKTRALELEDADQRTPLAIALDQKDSNAANRLVSLGADIARCLRPDHVERITTCSQIKHGHRAFWLAKYFNAQTRTLSFRGATFTNEDAAGLLLGNWKSCAVIDFRGNNLLTEIPVSVVDLDPNTDMKILLDDTPGWDRVEADVVKSGILKAIIEYPLFKANGTEVPINERKLMAVGFAAVGKTTLIRRLKNQNYTHPVSTDGVDMGELRLSTSTCKELRVVVWDFAGQPLYRHTHLLFLRNPGLCLLLFKLTDDVHTSVDQLRYWCETLRSVSEGNNHQVLLVGTHLDRCSDRTQAQSHAKAIWERLREYFPIVDPPILVNCAEPGSNEQTIKHLRQKVAELAFSMEVKAPSWIEHVRSALVPVARRQIPLLSSSEAHEIVINYTRQEGHSLLANTPLLREVCFRALQMLGSMLVVEHRGRITHVVVNPQWVALLLATVVTTRHAERTRGRLTYATLTNLIWRGNNRFPSETHETLVAILEQLKIMFPLHKQQRASQAHVPPGQREFFIPCSLPERRPHIRFSALPPAEVDVLYINEPSRMRRLFYLTDEGKTLPVDILPHIVAQLIERRDTKVLEVWQQGGVFQIKSSDEAPVFVSVCKLASDTIELIVSTPLPHIASTWLREVSTMIENQLTDVCLLNYEVRIPCFTKTNTCYLLLRDLRLSIAHQRQEARCHSGVHRSRISLLVPDLLFADLGSFVHQWSSIELLGQLGAGGFGKVMLGRLNSIEVAVKLPETQVSDTTTDAGTFFKEFQHEAYLMSLLQHENIVEFLGVCVPSHEIRHEYERSPALLMRVAGGGSLYDALNDSTGLFRAVRLAEDLKKYIGDHHTRTEMHRLKPDDYSCPEPLVSLNELCDSALARMDEILNRQFLASASDSEPNRASALQLHQEMIGILRTMHTGPMTPQMVGDFDQTKNALGTLASSLNEFAPRISRPLLLKLATDMARGLSYLHSLSPEVLHRDLKSPNVFLTSSLTDLHSTTNWHLRPLAKIGDFGLSIRSSRLLKAGQAMGSILPTWTAPEVLSNQGYSTEADVYSLGIVLWELLTRRHPFADLPTSIQAEHICAGGRPPLPPAPQDDTTDFFFEEYTQLVQDCWHQDPERRPLVSQVLSSLKSMCIRFEPEVFEGLDMTSAAVSTPVQQAKGAARKRFEAQQYQVVHVTSLPASKDLQTKVLCMQAVGSRCWMGLNTGFVSARQVDGESVITCAPTDRHGSSVEALNHNPQHSTVWSGSRDGQIIVWAAEPETLEAAKTRCYLKAKLVFQGTIRHCVLRNGVLHCYEDEHVGPAFLQLGVCDPDVVFEESIDALRFSRRTGAAREAFIFQRGDSSEDEQGCTLQVWTSTIAYLKHLGNLPGHQQGRGLAQLAASPPLTNSEAIKVLEVTDDATWCLKVTTLVEWRLVEAHHGLHTRLRLEPGRMLTFDMTSGGFSSVSLRSVCGVLWVSPNVLWLGAANTLAFIDLSSQPGLERAEGSSSSSSVAASSSSSESFSSVCPHCSKEHDGSCERRVQQSAPPQSRAQSGGSFVKRLFRFGSAALDTVVITPLQFVAEIGQDAVLAPLARVGSQAFEAATSGLSQQGSSPNSQCATCQTEVLQRMTRPCRQCNAALCADCSRVHYHCNDCRSRLALEQILHERSSVSNLELHWPSTLSSASHSGAIKLMALVESASSASSYEVWTYSPGERILVWGTPLPRVAMEETPCNAPVLLAEVPFADAKTELTCLRQVGPQLWAGTCNGTIVGWDVRTRAPLPSQPLRDEFHRSQQGQRRQTTSIAVFQADSSGITALSSGQEATLRRFMLQQSQ